MSPRVFVALAVLVALALVVWQSPQLTKFSNPVVSSEPAATPGPAREEAKPATEDKTASATPVTLPPPRSGTGEPDVAFGAFQRGYFLTAFKEATRRAEEQKDPQSMTLIAELYANGYGVPHDDKKALDWYGKAAALGDAGGTFGLAMFKLAGRGGPADREAGMKLLADAARVGHVAAAYDLGLLMLQGEDRNVAQAAEYFRAAAVAGNPEAQYALGTLYKEGRGVPRDFREAARLLGAAAAANFTDAQVEYAIALFNGNGVPRDEQAAAALLRKAAVKGNPIAQNRLARLLATGRGVPANAVEAAKWAIVAKAAGVHDTWLDNFVQSLTSTDRDAAQHAAQPWLKAQEASRS
jgi:TPR repeat protein